MRSQAKQLVIQRLLLSALCAVPATCPAAGDVNPLPVVWALATGGTMSAKGAASTSVTEYTTGTFLGEDLVAAVPEIKSIAEVRAEQNSNVGSARMRFALPSRQTQ
jgi:L-asparaginase/Glu-tRNA(Gln) amidotransferase subunit D